MSGFILSHIVYCDTNILSHLAKNKHLWSKFFDFLVQNNFALGIGGPQLSELSDAKKLHKILAEMFVIFPSVLLKPWDIVLNEEVQAHPHKRDAQLYMYCLNSSLFEIDGIQKLENQLFSSDLFDARDDQLAHAMEFPKRLISLMDNFPKTKSGKYSREQADEFSQIIVMQVLSNTRRDFLTEYQNNINDFHPEVFLSIQLFSQVIFYKYYLGQREPKRISDFGDLAHLLVIPYYDLVIMERDLCNILNQIKRNQDTLISTVVRNIDFF
jgi:hypothetical protein